MGEHFYRRTPYNKETQEQIWQTVVSDAHDSFCGCCQPLAHLLELLIPEDHKYRHWTIHQVIQRELQENKCLFGGKEEKDGGEAGEGPSTKETNIQTKEEKEDLTEEAIEELISAVDDAERR